MKTKQIFLLAKRGFAFVAATALTSFGAPLLAACPQILVGPASIPAPTTGTSYTQTISQSGAASTTFAVTSGILPTGLALTNPMPTSVDITGTPTQTGTFTFTLTATDAAGCTGGRRYRLTVACGTITVNTPATSSFTVGQALSGVTFTQMGASGTATFSLASGSLPMGVILQSNGSLTGTPTQTGSFPITVMVTDSAACTGTSGTYNLQITCPTITVTRTGGGSFPAATFNAAYAGQSVTASGGAAPYTFAVTGGTFPPGLMLAAAGTISGTPTATGTFVFMVTATDQNSCTGVAPFSIAVNPAPAPDAYNNLANNTQAAVTGGTTVSPATPFVPLTGTVIANDLPAGGVAVIAGTFPTTQAGSVTLAADGTFLYTPPVTASALASDTFSYTITSNTGGPGTPTMASGTVTLNLAGRVWYVKNNGSNGNGQSQSPFNSLSSFTNGARVSPDKPSDIIYVYTPATA